MPSKTVKQILNDNYWRGFQWHKRPDNDSDPDFAIETSLKDIESLINEVIGKDDHSMTKVLENPSWNDMRKQASLLGQNDLRKEQRERLTKLLGGTK